jgi:sugar/nucleoside kinase (ribokinase family)
MARQLTIVGIGEALLVENPDHRTSAGLAVFVARHAVALGHLGVVVSRIGQDPQATELLDLLTEAGVDTSHIQSDPDLPTGRVVVRAIGGTIARYAEARAAFDNLQADFDLEDVAQQADAVVYGVLTRREGQTRSEENRFLGACAGAVKVFDLTNGAGVGPERGHALSGLEFANATIVDRKALGVLRPGSADVPMRDAVAALMREAGLSFVVSTEPDDNGSTQLTLHVPEESWSGRIPADGSALVLAYVTILEHAMRGQPMSTALDRAVRVVEHAVAHPGAPLTEVTSG